MTDVGIVYLVGAGPGDPALLTIRGKECLERADVVVYDHLSNSALLTHAPEHAERIYAGKQAGQHVMTQNDINALLIRKAREGRTVVRLKGGDPYVFGRGAEEALALRGANIPFQVVPGVTSAVAAAAYAGIPLTHRPFNSVLTLVTGHEDPTKEESRIDWSALATGGGTLVFFMAVKTFDQIAKQLIAAGRSPETPAAAIRWGTLPQQVVAEGTLHDLTDHMQQAKLTPPCIIVVGEVAQLRAELNWFEKRPLFGKTIAITRPRRQADQFAAKLTDLGAAVVPFPTIRLERCGDLTDLHDCIRQLTSFDWIVFTSANGVDCFFDTLHHQGGDARALAGLKVACIGPATARQLAAQGISADLVPSSFTSKALFDAMAQRNAVAGRRVLLARADIAGDELLQRLRTAGADVHDLTVYRTLPDHPDADAIDALRSARVDVVTFTSASTARNFAAITTSALGAPPAEPKYVSIGPETSQAVRDQGMTVAYEADPHTIDGLIDAILKVAGGSQAITS